MRVIVNGALGRMGKTLTGILETTGHEIAAKVDANGDGIEVLRDFSACPKADVIIERIFVTDCYLYLITVTALSHKAL